MALEEQALGHVCQVLVVGAGLSGLSSVLHLLDDGTVEPTSITVLEGRQREGGRLKALEGVDVGGAWCWTSFHRQVPILAARFGKRTFPQHDSGVNLVDHGSSITRSRQQFDSPRLRIEGGAASLTAAMADHARGKGVRICLNCPVQSIATSNADGVLVTAMKDGLSEIWRAKVVFLSIPPRLAAPPTIRWTPDLPRDLQATLQATPTWMALTTKVLIIYSQPFWRDQGMSGNVISAGGGPIHQLYDSCGPDDRYGPYTLCGFIFDDAQQCPLMDDILRAKVLEQLTRLFGSKASDAMKVSVHRWANQPFTRGTAEISGGSHSDMGADKLREAFGPYRPEDPPRVWLSAAETDERHGGLMEGAVLAGRRVVEEALLGALAG